VTVHSTRANGVLSPRLRAISVALIVAVTLFYISSLDNPPSPGSMDDRSLESIPDTVFRSPRTAEDSTTPGPIGTDRIRSVPAQDASLESFKLGLSSRDYAGVIDRYDRIYVNSSVERSAVYRTLILEHASDSIQSGDAADASALLERYLSIYYTDVDALIVIGRAYREQRLMLSAIRSFQQAYQNEYRLAVRELIINQANNIIGEMVQELRQDGRQDAIVELYEELTRSQPEIPGYFVGLANAYAAARRYDDALRALYYVQSDVQVGPQARSLIAEFTALRSNP